MKHEWLRKFARVFYVLARMALVGGMVVSVVQENWTAAIFFLLAAHFHDDRPLVVVNVRSEP